MRLTGLDTDLNFSEVNWDTGSQDMPPYYSLRYSHWFDRAPAWGWSLDLTQAKMLSDPEQVLTVSGSRDGKAVDDIQQLADSYDRLDRPKAIISSR